MSGREASPKCYLRTQGEEQRTLPVKQHYASNRSTGTGRRQEGNWVTEYQKELPLPDSTKRCGLQKSELASTEGIIWDNSNESGLIKKSYSVAMNKHNKFSKFYLNKNSISIFYKQLLQRIPNFGSKATSKK